MPGGLQVKPASPINLRKLLLPAGARRPLDLERVTPHLADVDIGIDRPRMNDLAAGLADVANWSQCSGRRGNAELFFEFTSRHIHSSFTFCKLAFRDRPTAVVALLPVWSAGVDQQHLATPTSLAVYEQAGALAAQVRPLMTPLPSMSIRV